MVKMLCLGFSFLVYVLKESAFPWGGASLGLPCLWYCVMVWFSTCVFHVEIHVMYFNVMCKLEVLLCITQERLVAVLMS